MLTPEKLPGGPKGMQTGHQAEVEKGKTRGRVSPGTGGFPRKGEKSSLFGKGWKCDQLEYLILHQENALGNSVL